MSTLLLFAALLAGAQALPQAVTQGFTTSPNGPTMEEPCLLGDANVDSGGVEVFPCTMGVPRENRISRRQVGKPCTEDAQCSGPDCVDGGATEVCSEAGVCVCTHVAFAKRGAQDEPAIEISEEWKKVSDMYEIDACNLFEMLQCGNVKDVIPVFSPGACLSNGHIMFMEGCLPLFKALSKGEQDQKLGEVADLRDFQDKVAKDGLTAELGPQQAKEAMDLAEQKEKGAKEAERQQEKEAKRRKEKLEKEAKEKAEKEAKEKAEREKKEQAEIEKWKAQNPLWVKESGDSNTVINIGDQKTNFGSLDPWDVVSKIPELCSGQSCVAGNSSFSFDTFVYSPKEKGVQWKEGRKGVLTMSIDGTWDVAQDLGSRDQLLAAVKLTLDGLDKAGKIERKEKEDFVVGPCSAVGRAIYICKEREGDKNKIFNLHQWSLTNAIQVRVTNGPAGNRTLASYISIGFKLTVPDIDNPGGAFCGGAVGAGAGIAAMFPPPLGPAVAASLLLGAVFCGFAS